MFFFVWDALKKSDNPFRVFHLKKKTPTPPPPFFFLSHIPFLLCPEFKEKSLSTFIKVTKHERLRIIL